MERKLRTVEALPGENAQELLGLAAMADDEAAGG